MADAAAISFPRGFLFRFFLCFNDLFVQSKKVVLVFVASKLISKLFYISPKRNINFGDLLLAPPGNCSLSSLKKLLIHKFVGISSFDAWAALGPQSAVTLFGFFDDFMVSQSLGRLNVDMTTGTDLG
jgi:hypothetical protein